SEDGRAHAEHVYGVERVEPGVAEKPAVYRIDEALLGVEIACSPDGVVLRAVGTHCWLGDVCGARHAGTRHRGARIDRIAVGVEVAHEHVTPVLGLLLCRPRHEVAGRRRADGDVRAGRRTCHVDLAHARWRARRQLTVVPASTDAG